MRTKLYLLIACCCCCFTTANAQTFYQVTNLSGTQAVGGNNVTVSTVGGGNTTVNWCGAGPYWIGQAGGLGGYTWSFATPVSQVRVIMTALNDGEIVHFSVNGGNYPLNANAPGCYLLSNFMPTCAGSSVTGVVVVDANGNLTVNSGAGNGISSGAQIDIVPNAPISTITISHLAGFSGEVLGFYFANTGSSIVGCSGVTALADTPCAGGILHLMATSTSTYVPTTYSWTGPGNFTSNQQNPQITNVQLSDTGTYTVTMTDSVTHTATVHVSVRPKPGLPVVTNNGPLCVPGTLNLTATSTGANAYKWSGPLSFSSTQQNPSITPIAVANSGIYKVYATAANGCVSDTASTMVQIYPQVTAAYGYTVKWGCGTDTVVFTNASINGVSHTWYFGDGTNSLATDTSHIYTTQGTYNVKLVARSANCKDSVTQTIDLVHPLDASFTVDKDSICQLGAVQFTNTSITTIKNGINPTYLWIFDDGTTSTAMSPLHNYNRQGVYHVKLVVKDFVPCTDTAFHTIVVDSIPFIRFTISDSSICQGQAIHFEGDYLHIGNIGNLEWDLGDSTHLININPVTHGYDQPGTYTVTLTAHYRLCPDTTYRQAIDVRPFPGINLGPDTAICPNGAPINLTDLVGGGGAYLWSTGALSQAITVKEPGTYWAVKSLDGCTTADTVEVRKNCYTDIPNVFTPNGDGMNDYFFPRGLLSRGVAYFRMSIFNRWGQSIFETTSINGRGWDGRLNDKDQPQGVYIYTIDVAYIDGKKEKYQGNVTLLR